jgi:hypothetical protein
MGFTPIAAAVLDEAVERYGLLPVGRPVRCGFSCYLITLERAMRHPALAVILSRGTARSFHRTRSGDRR